ncbi:CDP-diacylglycerol pyrophosphatase [Paenibacillus forsythiae]|uniref:CDP-diacylglycerol pyrophosphatase n=1 Tax=Paenibacillus forsythiae TaxID=365616 RepID=A0ABU3H190_9BACL|nr:CDP-diacylglycerol pyrophosphatase [Paenibacillus forsythiae]
MRYIVFLMILLAVAVIYAVTRVLNTRKRKKGNPPKNNVIPLDAHRKFRKTADEQPCSSCKKKNGKLIFYAQDDGSVAGLCKDCQAKAKKRDMLPL